MATAKKLKSGSWRVLAYDYTDSSGKRHYKSFTAATKRQAELEAARYCASDHKHSAKADITFGEAVDQYIDQRSAVLSPSTIREYKGTARRYFGSLNDQYIEKITQRDIQQLVNELSKMLSPKSVSNVHGLISAVLAAYRPDFALHTALPKKIPPDLYIPSEGEIKRLLAEIQGTVMELPVLLAAFGPMRRGEICALRKENISGNIVHVCENMVQREDKTWVIKAPKSYAGDRYIDYPDFVAAKWGDIGCGRLVDMNPMMVTHRFEHNLQHAGLPHFRFHDLRHYSASIQHALGIPDAYIMQRGGWNSDSVLKQVYRHALEDKTKEMNVKINGYFESMQHEMQHEKKKPL